MSVARELAEYKLYLGVYRRLDVTMRSLKEKGIIFVYGKGNVNHQMGTGLSMCHRRLSEFKIRLLSVIGFHIQI